MIPSILYLNPLNTQVIQITGLQDAVTGQFLNAAVVVATLFDSKGNADPLLNGLPMTYVPGSQGVYQGVVPITFNPQDVPTLKVKSGYTLQVMADQAGVQAVWMIPVQITPRRQ